MKDERSIKEKILFISGRGAARARMACAVARGIAPEDVEIECAGIKTVASSDLMAEAVIRDAGYSTDGTVPLDLEEARRETYQLVVTIGAATTSALPVMPGPPAVLSWDIPEPAQMTPISELEREGQYAECLETIETFVRMLFVGGFYKCLEERKHHLAAVLDNLTDGIIVHDNMRRISFFNSAAERITGFDAKDVIGRYCQDVFNGGFCQHKCNFKDGNVPEFDHIRYPLDFLSRDGDMKKLDMSVVPMADADGENVGVIAVFSDRTQQYRLEQRLGEEHSFSGIVGRDHDMQAVFRMIRDLSGSEAPVLVLGETGTGKELVAGTIHNESRRGDGLFVPVNCGALPEGVIESKLFGHVRGAFTGAVRDRKGRFEMADGGTIFLDEVAELPAHIQVKLLGVLQEGTIERVGGEGSIKVDCRVISATNRNLRQMMQEGRFREDLYYRLAVVPLYIPPLRDRRNDIPLLAEHFLRKMSRGDDGGKVSFAPGTMDIFMDYDWPGNVRQLQNAIQFALVKSRGEDIEPVHLPPDIIARFTHARQMSKKPGRKKKLDRESVRQALRKAGGNKAKAARALGVSRATLYRFISEEIE